ncbi:glycosyltransferase family 4 protein [Halohasta litorea]|uniref:Glycosyltransferase family 4 protein n=1 Tax=Halohasta litorea TaxID=869891 RepID=A0ABD6D8R0_9EURY|nr:glycosyltransferase family 4 protein [Halohasta litorea]
MKRVSPTDRRDESEQYGGSTGDSLRILRVASDIYPDVSGGLGLHVHHLSREQGERGHDVHVLAAEREGGGRGRREDRDGYTVHYHPELAAPFGNSLCPSIGRSLYEHLAEFDVLHAHSHLFFSTNMAAVAGRLTETPFVLTNHGLRSQTAPPWLQDLYLPTVGRFTFEAADSILCYTDTDSRRLDELGVDTRRRVIHNGIDCSVFRPVETERSDRQLLYVGRLTEAKGVQLLIRAVAHLDAEFPDLSLIVVGEGPNRGHLDALVDELGLEETVTFVGRLPNEQLPELYSESTLFVLPSRNEGMPRTVLEALACETPGVTTPLPQLTTVLSDGGLTVDDREPSAFARAIAELLEAPDRRRAMGRAGRRRVVEHHSWETTVEETLAEYYALLDDQPTTTATHERRADVPRGVDQ